MAMVQADRNRVVAPFLVCHAACKTWKGLGVEAARLGDPHICPAHGGGPILPACCATVLIGGQPAARATDLLGCPGPPDLIASGSPTVLIGCLFAARHLDPSVHGGVISLGIPTVLIGDGVGGTTTVPFGTVVGNLNGMPIVRAPDGILKVGDAIILAGKETFQSKTLADVIKIGHTPTGAALLSSINQSNKTLTIQPLAPGNFGNATGYSSPANRFYKPDGSAGIETDATVDYDPDTTTIGTESWETRPPAIGLGHEMVHADQAMHGTMSSGNTTNDSKPDPGYPGHFAQEKTREVEAAGIPHHDTRPFTENKLRQEWDPS